MKLECDIAEAVSDIDIAQCFPVMVQLRPHLAEEAFVGRVRALRASGFRLAAVRVENRVVAVAGFRIADNLFHGKFLYVDDLITDAGARSNGYGAQLFNWLVQLAKEENCTTVELDSGVQRFAAHRFYLREGMEIRSHHFSRTI